jgi:hypothetical protein
MSTQIDDPQFTKSQPAEEVVHPEFVGQMPEIPPKYANKGDDDK